MPIHQLRSKPGSIKILEISLLCDMEDTKDNVFVFLALYTSCVWDVSGCTIQKKDAESQVHDEICGFFYQCFLSMFFDQCFLIVMLHVFECFLMV
jgi:hypothetical protein